MKKYHGNDQSFQRRSQRKETVYVDEQADIPTQKSIFEEENDVMGQLEVDPLKKQWRMKRRTK